MAEKRPAWRGKPTNPNKTIDFLEYQGNVGELYSSQRDSLRSRLPRRIQIPSSQLRTDRIWNKTYR